MWSAVLDIWYTAVDWFWFYVRFVIQLWEQMTPLHYAILLTTIAIMGFVLMGRSMKRL
ncbi:hypothetical protein [Stratiformator vulcanicus]|uniref:Uncharacterized protein n=1 Tax=Stratiformator vulcanicus TaxID=2527980 RepID=A0A517R090_9PLAN|nr:hypothetical protein [Stratiformator vulcanicus]QDT37317.1 hypothetical protein Pan189_16900 [Stratiformator vulcanicus]